METEIVGAVNGVDPSARERELQLAREAIVLVASGASPRVVIAGIRYANDILDAAAALAADAGITTRVVRIGETADLVIETASA